MFLRKDPTSSIQPIESRCSLSPPRGRVEHRQGEGAFSRTHARYAHTAGFRFSCSPFTGGRNRLIKRPIGVKALPFVVDEAMGEGIF